jgi:hypothetical protein
MIRASGTAAVTVWSTRPPRISLAATDRSSRRNPQPQLATICPSTGPHVGVIDAWDVGGRIGCRGDDLRVDAVGEVMGQALVTS